MVYFSSTHIGTHFFYLFNSCLNLFVIVFDTICEEFAAATAEADHIEVGILG